MKKISVLLLALMASLTFVAAADDAFVVDGMLYGDIDGYTVSLLSWDGNRPTGVLEIPSSVTYNGTTFSVTKIGDGAFNSCTGLTSVTIPNSVTDISLEAFNGCTGLTNVTLSNALEWISPYAFANCRSLTSVTIPNSVTSIGEGAFEGSGLTDIYSEIMDPSRVELDHNVFIGVPKSTCVLHVPAGTAALYRTAAQWNEFTNIVEPAIVITSISLDHSELSLTEGETATLTATVLPDDATDKGVTWSSSDTSVATVENGVVTAVAAGIATITATTTDGSELSASCAVTVTEPEHEYYLIGYLDTQEAFTNDNGVFTLSKRFEWLDGDDGLKFLVRDENGNMYGRGQLTKASPSVTLTPVTTSSESDWLMINPRCEEPFEWVFTLTIENGVLTVTDWPIPPESMSIDPSAITLTVGDSYHLSKTVLPENYNVFLDYDTYWESSNGTVAAVDYDGNVTAIAPGTATINAYLGGGAQLVDAQCVVTVVPVPATTIALNHREVTLTEGETLALTATVLPADAAQSVTWSSSDTSVATVVNGVVTAVSSGTATITATTADGSNLSASCAVTVNPLIIIAESISIDSEAVTLTEGETATLTATVLPEDATDKGVTWSSSDTSVATVENGVVTAVAAGTATITATTTDGSELSASCAVTVNPLIIIAESISLDRDEVTLTEGETATLTATVLPEDATDKGVTWSSSDSSVATVENGVVTAVAAGTATITATTTDGTNLSASCTVTVNPLIIIAESISLDRNVVALSAGTTAALTATVLPADATDKGVTWSSSDSSVATVENGVVTAVAAGTATITATTTDGSDLSASCTVTVIAQQLVNELSVADYRCMAGDTFTIDVSLSNGNEIGGVQFDLYLPESFSVALDNDGKPDITLDENRSDGHQLMVNSDFTDGHLNVMAFSMGNEAFVGNDGAVIHINVVADNALAGGDYVLELRDIELAVPDGSDAYNYASLTSTITVMMMGDANADGRVTVSDVLIVARRANGYVVDGLNDAIVDMNGDGRITVSDLLIVANISNNGQAAASGAPMRRAPRRANELSADNHLAIADVTCDPGERFTLPVEMVNPDEIGGFMFDLYLPEGFTIGLNKKGKLDVTLEQDRIEDHTLQFNNTFDDGHLHVQAFSMNNEPFYDNEGPVVYIAIVADDNVSAGIHTAAVRMIELSSPSGQENRQDDEGFTFNINVAGEVTQTESITLDRNEVTLAEGETTTLTATVLPEDATDKGVSWSSSDESVATVDAAGTVTAVAAGTATITATTTDGSELSASCVVTVEAQQHSDGLSADNYLAIADVTCDPGERFTLPVEMVNPDEIGGFMFDLYLPEGFTIGLNKKGKLDITLEQDRIEDHMLQFNNSFDDGHLHVQAFSMSNEPFYGNEGPVVYIAIVADDNVPAGIHTAAVRMIELSSPSGMENRQDDEGFTFDINVAGGLTLAEVLSNGTDGSDYSISNTLAVVKKSEDNVHAYVTDGEGNWARLEGDAVAGLEEGAGVVGVAGTLSASGIAPTITLSAEPVLSTAVPYEIATIDLSRAFREMPMPCQVVTINGFFDGTKLRAYRAYPQGQGIAVDLGHSTADLEIGKKYIVTAAIELLEPWENDAPNGAPARIKTDDSNALDNLKAGILESQLDLETGIVDLAADDGDGVYYNLLGVPVQHPTPGIYIHNGKKVVVR